MSVYFTNHIGKYYLPCFFFVASRFDFACNFFCAIKILHSGYGIYCAYLHLTTCMIWILYAIDTLFLVTDNFYLYNMSQRGTSILHFMQFPLWFSQFDINQMFISKPLLFYASSKALIRYQKLDNNFEQ